MDVGEVLVKVDAGEQRRDALVLRIAHEIRTARSPGLGILVQQRLQPVGGILEVVPPVGQIEIVLLDDSLVEVPLGDGHQLERDPYPVDVGLYLLASLLHLLAAGRIDQPQGQLG